MAGEAGARRASEVARLSALLRRSDGGLAIACISGPGGVGKTYLLEHVLAAEHPIDNGYLHLSADGSNPQTRCDFFGLIDAQLAARGLPPPALPGRDYFPQLRQVASEHRDLVDRAAAELDTTGAPPEVKRATLALLRTAHRLNQVIPKTKSYLDVARLGIDDRATEQALDDAWELVGRLKSLRRSMSFPGPMRDLLGITRANRVRNDLFNVTADALLSDVTAAISGYARKDRWTMITHERIEGLSRLLLVLDDYEAIAPVLGDFLVGSLVPRLAEAPFPTTLVIACRDDLEATHPGWAQHAKRWLREDIRLAPFDRPSAEALMAEAGVPEARREALYESTRGFPFLLTLAIEEATARDAESALFAKKFFDRTTRWMSAQQREWFSLVVYLEDVNEDTLGALFEPDQVSTVQDWFESESSIRDPDSRTFRVRPLVREKALRYLETRSPSRHRGILAKLASRRTPPDPLPESLNPGPSPRAADDQEPSGHRST